MLEYSNALHDVGISYAPQRVSDALLRMGYTRKLASKVKKYKYRQENMKHYLWVCKQLQEKSWDNMHFMDQTGIDPRNCGPKRARSKKGTRAFVDREAIKSGDHFTIQGICNADPNRQQHVAYNILSGADTYEDHEAFMMRLIECHYLRPGDIVWHDNVSVYTGTNTGGYLANFLLEQFNIYFLELPTYSPELNNIELLWCALKMHLRKYRAVKNNEELLFIAKTYLDNVSCEAIQKQQDHVKKIICELMNAAENGV